jgi:hypothetical protein
MLVLDNKYGINTRMTIVQFPVYVGYPASKEVIKGYSNVYVSTKEWVMSRWPGMEKIPKQSFSLTQDIRPVERRKICLPE